mmetsp:Transcript_67516/g.162038  ORF Transcript_67516/g.162038 Transcript_67516/m.162038 type:complete len:293 (+) Transcript_67516:73-951(+)
MRRTKRAGKDDGDCRVKSGSSQLYSHVLWGKVSADSEDSDADAALDGEVEETCTPEIPHKDNFELPLGATIAMKVKRAKVFLESDGESEQGEDTVSMMGQAGVLNASPRAAPSSSHAIHAGNSSSGMNNAVAMVHRPNSRSSEGVTEAAGHEVMPLTPSLPSVGSALHRAGQCRPCAWNWTEVGCNGGSQCRYCHLCGEEDFRLRVSQRRLQRAALWRAERQPSFQHRRATAADSTVPRLSRQEQQARQLANLPRGATAASAPAVSTAASGADAAAAHENLSHSYATALHSL